MTDYEKNLPRLAEDEWLEHLDTNKLSDYALTIIAAKSGIQLDIACGANKQAGYVGLDIQPLEGVDIVHDLNVHPWPLPDESVLRAIASHIVEHIPPVTVDGGRTRFLFIEFMDEVWRVLKPGGEFAIACPHGASPGYLQDPTHCNAINETTWAYFDQGHPFYQFYKPRPWRIKFINWNPAANMEVVLIKEPAKALNPPAKALNPPAEASNDEIASAKDASQ